MGWWSGHKVIDPSELEGRFAVEDGMAFMDAVVSEEVSDEGVALLERVRSVMDQLPDREADFIDLYYFRHLKQTDIASIFGVSQPTVCYRLQRAAARIQFLLSLPAITPEEMDATLDTLLTDPLDKQIMKRMLSTTCQSVVAKEVGKTQGLVRHRFIRTIKAMRTLLRGAVNCTTVAQEIRENPNHHLSARRALTKFLGDATDAEVLILQARGRHPGEIADMLEIGVDEVRMRLDAVEDRLEFALSLQPYIETFQAVSDNLNILREVQRSEWDVGVRRVLA